MRIRMGRPYTKKETVGRPNHGGRPACRGWIAGFAGGDIVCPTLRPRIAFRLSPLAGRGFGLRPNERSEAGARGVPKEALAPTAAPQSAAPHPSPASQARRLAAFASRVFPACAPRDGPR